MNDVHRPVSPRSPWRTTVATIAITALVAVGCASDDSNQDLERQLGDANAEIALLVAANRQLEAELEQAREQLAARGDDDGANGSEGSPPDTPPDPDDGSDDADRISAAMERSPEGLIDQLRMRVDFGELPDGWEPATTGWRDYDLPEEVLGVYAEPGLFATDLARVLDGEMLGLDVWETTVRVLAGDAEDQATVAVLSWGFADDSVRGQDVRVAMIRDDGAWLATDAEIRFHCLRGVSGDLCV